VKPGIKTLSTLTLHEFIGSVATVSGFWLIIRQAHFLTQG